MNLLLKLLGLLTGVGEWLGKLAKAIGRWSVQDWRNAVLLVAAFYWAANTFLIHPSMRADIATAEQKQAKADKALKAEKAAHQQTVRGFRTATRLAEQRGQENEARAIAEQQAISRSTIDDLQSRLAATRDRYLRAVRLREAAGAAGTNPGSAAPAYLPGTGGAAAGIAAAPGDHAIPAGHRVTPKPDCPAHLVCLSFEEARAAEDDASRHHKLIDWAIAQSQVRTTPATGGDDGNE